MSNGNDESGLRLRLQLVERDFTACQAKSIKREGRMTELLQKVLSEIGRMGAQVADDMKVVRHELKVVRSDLDKILAKRPKKL
jgi:hypothetical protein